MLADITPIDTDTVSLLHPDAQALYYYWLNKRGQRPMPRRSDIDPTEIPPRVLPGISLVEVVPDDRRYVYRLMGTAEVQVRGFDPTGKSVLEGFLAPDVNDALGCYDKVVAKRIPLVDPVPFIAADGRYVPEETIFLPLSDDGSNVNKILIFCACRDLDNPAARVRLEL
jgi:hypothetical protein